MARTLHFHVDESCDPRIAAGLRLHGIDVSLSQEVDLLRATDETQLAYAVAHGRVIITQDADFLRLHSAGRVHPGIVCFPPSTRAIGQVVQLVRLIWELLEPEEMQNHIEYV